MTIKATLSSVIFNIQKWINYWNEKGIIKFGGLILMHKAGNYLIRSNTSVTFFSRLALSGSFLSRDTIFSMMMSSAFLANLSTICCKHENIRCCDWVCFITVNPLKTKTIASFYSLLAPNLETVHTIYYKFSPLRWMEGVPHAHCGRFAVSFCI